MPILPGDAGSQPVRFQPRPAPAAPPPSQWRGFPSAAAPVRSAGAPPTHTDASTGGGNYGATQVNAFKQSPGYRQAIVETYLHQPIAQQGAIVRGALRIPSLEGHAVLNYLKSQGTNPRSVLVQAADTQHAKSGGIDLGQIPGVSLIGGGLNRMFPGKATSTRAGSSGGGEIGGGMIGSSTPFGGSKGAGQILQAGGKDVLNLPATAVTTAGILGSDVVTGNLGKLASDLTSYPRQLIQHPELALKHPVDTGMLFLGGAHPVLRAGERIIRGVQGKGPADVSAPSVSLTGNLTHERPNFSKNPAYRGVQKANAASLYKTTPGGDLVPRSQALREQQIRKGVSEQVGVNERIRKADVMNQVAAHARAVLPSRPARIAGGTANLVKYNPSSTFIHGAGVLARIAGGTIRRADTLKADLAKHIAEVSATRGDLLDMPRALAEHDQYVKELNAALADKALMRNPSAAFAAVAAHAKDYAPLEAEAATHGHFGDMTSEALQRRALQEIVHAHMPGARLDPVLGMVKDTRGADGKVVTRKLSTDEMQKFAMKETKGRGVVYASHQAPKGDSAFYSSGQKYPTKAVQGNTLYAYRHGLTDPSHEALLQARAHLTNVINGHRSMNRNLETFTVRHPSGGGWESHAAALRDAPGYAAARGESPTVGGKPAYQPIYTGRLPKRGDVPTPGEVPLPANLEEEAMRHSMSLNARLQPSDVKGNWSLVHHTIVDQLRQHENQISPNTFMRTARAVTTQFRKVALGTSIKHLPGIAQESLIRAVAEGAGLRSWIAGGRGFNELAKTDPRLAQERRVQTTGGTVSGMTEALSPRQVSRHFAGTSLEPPVRAFGKFMAAPGIRPLGNAWRAWTRFAIQGTKNYLEHNVQQAGVGKMLLQDRGKAGSILSDWHNIMGLQGEALKAAGDKLKSDQYARKLYAGQVRMWGKWTDMTPSGQTALMFSPFGMWWANSMHWLARLPVDHPMGTAALASAEVGTEKQRQALGLDFFAPNHLPAYKLGGIPLGNGKIWNANYYSPPGVANDPFRTAADLILPALTPVTDAAKGLDWQGKALTSPSDPRGQHPANPGEVAGVIVNSMLGLLVPLYQKAQTIAQGGASSYDTGTPFSPQTKGANPGPLAGLEKAVFPIRESKGLSAGASSSSGGAWTPVGGGGGSGGGVPTPSGGSGGGAWTPVR